MVANAILAAVKIGALGEGDGLLSVAVVKDALLWERGMPLVAEAMPLTGDTVSKPSGIRANRPERPPLLRRKFSQLILFDRSPYLLLFPFP